MLFSSFGVILSAKMAKFNMAEDRYDENLNFFVFCSICRCTISNSTNINMANLISMFFFTIRDILGANMAKSNMAADGQYENQRKFLSFLKHFQE